MTHATAARIADLALAMRIARATNDRCGFDKAIYNIMRDEDARTFLLNYKAAA